MRISVSKTLFFSFVVKFFLFLIVHRGSEVSDMGHEFFGSHLLLWSDRGCGGRVCRGSFLIGTVLANVSGFLAPETESLSHEFCSFFRCQRIDGSHDGVDVHRVRVFPGFEVPLLGFLPFVFFWYVAPYDSLEAMVVVVEFQRPFVPIFQVCGGIGEVHDFPD